VYHGQIRRAGEGPLKEQNYYPGNPRDSVLSMRADDYLVIGIIAVVSHICGQARQSLLIRWLDTWIAHIPHRLGGVQWRGQVHCRLGVLKINFIGHFCTFTGRPVGVVATITLINTIK
jgi:hypothetical protein